MGDTPINLSVVGTLGWVGALIATARALRGAGAPRGPFVLLIVAGVFLTRGHLFPFGTLALGCFFVAIAWLELAQRATNSVNPNAVNREVTPT
jgi:hypothetical protein